MPIYAYRCASCGHTKDVLQKMSDSPLSTCPVCAQETFQKQLTAAGFQLKGSGWYVTDFRDKGASASSAEASTAHAPAAASTSTSTSTIAADNASNTSATPAANTSVTTKPPSSSTASTPSAS